MEGHLCTGHALLGKGGSMPKSSVPALMSDWDSLFDVDTWTKCLVCSRSFPEHDHQNLQNGVHIKENIPRKLVK